MRRSKHEDRPHGKANQNHASLSAGTHTTPLGSSTDGTRHSARRGPRSAESSLLREVNQRNPRSRRPSSHQVGQLRSRVPRLQRDPTAPAPVGADPPGQWRAARREVDSDASAPSPLGTRAIWFAHPTGPHHTGHRRDRHTAVRFTGSSKFPGIGSSLDAGPSLSARGFSVHHKNA